MERAPHGSARRRGTAGSEAEPAALGPNSKGGDPRSPVPKPKASGAGSKFCTFEAGVWRASIHFSLSEVEFKALGSSWAGSESPAPSRRPGFLLVYTLPA